ncbi:hypothetical protein JZ751_019810 [Albula glossodonta]|uniref:LRRCT domain-containing protein n=1 Tax=Albula glossodonta TaxID=121402 RepID=A0A8T2NN51_9TELE|nr:hypothetical protein JZ751_019810 [Albula glossodonta]
MALLEPRFARGYTEYVLRLFGCFVAVFLDNVEPNVMHLGFAVDLSENFIQAIPRKAFRGATDIKNLQLDKNHIGCIEDGAFRALRGLEVLTLNNNNISSIPVSSFNHMPKLRTFRLHSNNLHCDCHLAWLAQWLRQRPTIGLFTQCAAPPQLRGINVAEIQKHEFSCSGKRRGG